MSKPISDTSKIKKLARQFPWLPWTFIRIYVYPMLMRGNRVPMNAKVFFDEHYAEVERAKPIDDAGTISAVYDPMHAQLHYNAVEGSILRALVDIKAVDSVLDIGSGSGHWIDFMRRIFNPNLMVAADISEPVFRFLRKKYGDSVRVEQSNIVQDRPSGQFDVITAIGVMFHIIDDDALLLALSNLKEALAPNGVLLVGGHFGLTTRDIMFKRCEKGNMVTKRTRSLRWWRRVPGLRVVKVVRTKNPRGFLFPENNLLVLAHRNYGLR